MNQPLFKLVTGSEKKGHLLVDPSFHTNQHFQTEPARESAGLFSARFLNHPAHDLFSPATGVEEGSTPKVHFRVGGRTDDYGHPAPSALYMVKPYYEDLSHWQYGHYPLSGWAEMMYPGILKAAKMEDLAMKVHAFPYANSSLLGIELDHGFHPVGSGLPILDTPWNDNAQAGRVNFSHVREQAAKLGALDFLLNNQDRNLYNLLMKVNGKGEATNLLAIDNGLSGQYLEANRFARAKNVDRLFYYLESPAHNAILGKNVGHLRAIGPWWKNVKPDVVREFTKHVEGIKHPALATHMYKSFKDRVSALDNFSDDVEKHGVVPYKEYKEGNVNNVNKPLISRSSVKVRKLDNPPWEPVAPAHAWANEGSCYSCGEDY